MSKAPLSLLAMQGVKRWVAYTGTLMENGKLNKAPICPRSGRNAKNNDPRTWDIKVHADRFVASASKNNAKPGVGIVLGEIEPGLYLMGVDLDGCYNPKNKDLEVWAKEILKKLGAYAELSPSGTGLKIFFLYRSREDPCKLIDGKKKKEWKHRTHYGIELHIKHSYFTVTGDSYDLEAGVDELTGLFGRLVEVSEHQLEWLISYAGATFKRLGAHARDESGSGYGFRFLQNLAREGINDEHEAISRLQSDTGDAGEWGNRASDRELRRSWNRALEHVQRQGDDLLSELDEDPQGLTWGSDDPVVAELNIRHAVVRNGGRILAAWFDELGGIEFGSVEDVHKWYANRTLPIINSNRRQPISRYWLGHSDRRQYNRVVFLPDESRVKPDELNLWRGWAISPGANKSAELLLRHIFEVLANGNQEHFDYIIGWLAHLIQRPGEKPGVALVFKGGKGAGKDTLAVVMKKIVGNSHTAHINRPDLLTQKFNAHFETALFAHVEEAFWAGSKQDKGALQALITSETTTLERKGIDPITIPSFVRLFLTTNEDWVVPASADERRYAVFNVSDARIGDRDYFDALYSEIGEDGVAAFLEYLINHELSDFEVRNVPQTGALVEQKLASLSGLERWWYDVLSDGVLPMAGFNGEKWHETEILVERSALRNSYDDYVRSSRFQGETVTSEVFGRKLRELVPGLQDRRPTISGSRSRMYAFPVLHEVRKAFETKINGRILWEDETQDVQDDQSDRDEDDNIQETLRLLV
ncbi:hypothetical protein JQV27_13275 [Sulfitobacter mediterraneus]|uniref:primase-helicase family protein n=1 Tax=Sulfitobacter mediterraneus TaxID=83219 RepID=UPI0019330C0F|nr:primase-helicase family protein [Sulfitobacter mediterraneus]MBM1633880.1 hypothetical protein [Sulfitobacter mediterraneus]MBM1641605.1 hypothetical protein [Sulfitobacter mediterraneus]MBM1645744.1 hypothetical protein [Sulfitobacter mediterraneus]MBM1649724.1 hypothetical protein [Sulfitobacter mediterraneus]MBM1653813.1 hypothetical protein [Sulfitobacter mediterraneus]